MFTAEAFTDQYKEEGKSQSFSGVGAQHKNAEVERAIQSVVYISGSSMIHCVLHWGENGSDNLALWSIALDHAAGLYNKKIRCTVD
jgi:hypothetical protein